MTTSFHISRRLTTKIIIFYDTHSKTVILFNKDGFTKIIFETTILQRFYENRLDYFISYYFYFLTFFFSHISLSLNLPSLFLILSLTLWLSDSPILRLCHFFLSLSLFTATTTVAASGSTSTLVRTTTTNSRKGWFRHRGRRHFRCCLCLGRGGTVFEFIAGVLPYTVTEASIFPNF